MEKARHKRYQSNQYNLNKEEITGKKKAWNDDNKVFLPTDKGRVKYFCQQTKDKWESQGGDQSYEFNMKQVLIDLKAKPSI